MERAVPHQWRSAVGPPVRSPPRSDERPRPRRSPPAVKLSFASSERREYEHVLPVHRLAVERTFDKMGPCFQQLLTDLWELSDAQLDDRIRSNEMERRRLDAEQAALVTLAEHRQLPAVDEHRSMNAYLRATLNCSPGEASRVRSLARAVDDIDGMGDAWLAGRFGSSQAIRLAAVHGNRRVRHRLSEFTPMLLDHAERLSYTDFGVCVDRFITHADQDGAHDARDDAVENRDARVVDVGGMVDVTAHGGDGISAAEMIAIFQRFCEAEFRNDVDARRREFGADADQHPLPRTARQRRFDALRMIFRAAASAQKVGTLGEPLVNIVIDAATWTELLAASGLAPAGDTGIDPALIGELVGDPVPMTERRCETSTGISLHPHDVLRAALNGHVRRVVVDSNSVVVDMGRRQRLFTGAAREAARLLLIRCEHPGCELSAELCDIDHSIEWKDGGSTDQTNSGPECSSHNIAKTRRKWKKRRALDGRNYTIRVDGTIILPVGVRRPIFPADDDHDADDDHTREEIAQLEQRARSRTAALTAA